MINAFMVDPDHMGSMMAMRAAQNFQAMWDAGTDIPTRARPGDYAGTIAEMLSAARSPLPEFRADGMLPEGVWSASWGEFLVRFAITPHRESLARRAEEALNEIRISGVADAVIGGSYVSAKQVPGDIDIAVQTERALNADLMRRVILNTRQGFEQRGVSVHPLSMRNADLNDGSTMLDFFMTDRDGAQRGVVLLNLGDVGL